MLQDSTLARDAGSATPYDSVWAAGDALHRSGPFEQVMLAQDKIYVVLTVVLIIWLGLILFMIRTDKKLGSLERAVDERIAPGAAELPESA